MSDWSKTPAAALGLALLLLAHPLRAETLRLTLADAVGRGLTEGAAAKLAGAEIERATALADQARAALRPQVTGSVLEQSQSINFETFGFIPPGLSPVVGPFYVLDGHLTAALNVLQIAAHKRLDAARQGIQVAKAERLETENQVATAISTLYVALLRARAQTAASRANVELAEHLAASADRQLDAGTATRIDSTRSQVQLARQRDAQVAARAQEAAAQLALLRAVGAPMDAEVELVDALLEQPPAPVVLADALVAARAGRPDLQASSERVLAAEIQVAAAKADRLPTIGLQAQGGYSGNNVNNLLWTRAVGALVTVPIYTGGLTPARIAEATTRLEEARIEHHDLERQVEQDVRRAILDYEAAQSRVALAERNRALANEELDHAQERFSSGVANALEVDNAQNSVTTATDIRVAALAAQAQAWFDVEHATGRIRELIPSAAPSAHRESDR
ncbi:MAG: TolC family protein [Acidobacteriota bacterium]